MTHPSSTAGRALAKAAPIALTLLLGACSVFGIRDGTEQRQYTIVETLSDSIEIRSYAEAAYAEARISADVDSPRNKAFRSLFRYITGSNQGAQEIAMTAPVSIDETARPGAESFTVETRASEGDAGGPRDTVMRFYLPADIAPSQAPLPSDPTVKLGVEPAMTVAVLRYTWSTGKEAFDTRRKELAAYLAEGPDGWTVNGVPFALYYDPPWTLPFLRRNEVAIPVIKAN